MVTRPVPMVGQVVHYYARNVSNEMYSETEPRAAMVTYVFEEKNPESPLCLTVFTPHGILQEISQYRVSSPGCWCWPLTQGKGET
jgi:hypothetical protein